MSLGKNRFFSITILFAILISIPSLILSRRITRIRSAKIFPYIRDDADDSPERNSNVVPNNNLKSKRDPHRPHSPEEEKEEYASDSCDQNADRNDSESAGSDQNCSSSACAPTNESEEAVTVVNSSTSQEILPSSVLKSSNNAAPEGGLYHEDIVSALKKNGLVYDELYAESDSEQQPTANNSGEKLVSKESNVSHDEADASHAESDSSAEASPVATTEGVEDILLSAEQMALFQRLALLRREADALMKDGMSALEESNINDDSNFQQGSSNDVTNSFHDIFLDNLLEADDISGIVENLDSRCEDSTRLNSRREAISAGGGVVMLPDNTNGNTDEILSREQEKALKMSITYKVLEPFFAGSIQESMTYLTADVLHIEQNERSHETTDFKRIFFDGLKHEALFEWQGLKVQFLLKLGDIIKDVLGFFEYRFNRFNRNPECVRVNLEDQETTVISVIVVNMSN